MKIVFTRSTLLGKFDLITWGLEEPVSHVGIEFLNTFVFHSTLWGVEVLSKNDFYEHRQKVFSVGYDIPEDIQFKILKFLATKYTKRSYDWKFFWWLVWQAFKLKFFRKPIPNKVVVQDRRAVLCTEALELLPDNIRPKYDASTATTPYRLYRMLVD